MLLILFFSSFLSLSAQCPTNTPNSTFNPSVFDWTQERFTLYVTDNQGNPRTLTNIFSPFYRNQGEIHPNTDYLVEPLGLNPKDYQPSDGWELLYYSLGSPNNYVNVPFFALYNRYESRVRMFAFAFAGSGQSGLLRLSFEQLQKNPLRPNGNEWAISSLFEHLNTPMGALDNFNKNNVQLNAFQEVTVPVGTWFVADFVAAYDPCTCNYSTGVNVKPWLTKNISVDLKTNLTGTGTGTLSEMMESDKVKNTNDGIGGILGAISGFAGAVNKGIKTSKDIGEAAGTLAKFANGFKNINVGRGGFKLPSWFDAIPVAINVIEFLTGGGKSAAPPKPTVFNADLKFEFKGTITGNFADNQPYSSKRYFVPNSNFNQNTSDQGSRPIYNNTLGVINVLETPQIEYKIVEQEGYQCAEESCLDYEYGNYDLYCLNPITLYYDGYTAFRTIDIKLLNDIKYAINPSVNLTPKSIQASLHIEIPRSELRDVTFTTEGLIFVSTKENVHIYRTPYLSLYELKSYVSRIKFQANHVVGSVSNYPQCPDAAYSPLKTALHFVANLSRTDVANASDAFYSLMYKTAITDVMGFNEHTDFDNAASLRSRQENLIIDGRNLTEGIGFSAYNEIEIQNYDLIPANVSYIFATAPTVKIKDSNGQILNYNFQTSPVKIYNFYGFVMFGNFPVPASEVQTSFCNNPQKYNPWTVLSLKDNDVPSVSILPKNKDIKIKDFHVLASPNPMSEQLYVDVNIQEESKVTIEVINSIGQIVKTVKSNELMPEGRFLETVNVSDLSRGIYILKVNTGNITKTLKLVK